jgi:CBS domain containing-hemolysin-like protein
VRRKFQKLAFGAAMSVIAAPSFASLLSPAVVDSVADFLAIFVIVLVPVVGIGLFWIVHILPEKIAEKRHHPQKDAIKVLCLLSLVFGGMLWPFAWLWAYSKPVLHKLAYGRDKHDEYYVEQANEMSTDATARGDDQPSAPWTPERERVDGSSDTRDL